ncbi:3-oxoacyl-[acyl-carrier-protein] synthase II [Amycolatopsis lexingtonensis]|uniref:3-oxoacyl-[acyl-carrier-protein] synthase II n=1 Tax=Amycolatopsis lexingtonensis TaxID=218822 RepID=A0ABR9IF65_9PSEU|nr:beta-ketoacyl synthase N-terminal-like domain-containing protein [Amycolatopsis lexingtonensis]MBE1501824.1 3-oxoacyl-[acyl-carrier-protein] synthase II [Amycolatopsis lexingtonensis]
MIVTDWAAISPFGVSTADFSAGVLAGAPDGPRTVPGFDPRELLGKQASLSMTRSAALAAATCARLAAEDDVPARTGLVLATTTGSVQSILDVTRISLTGKKPYRIPPSTILGAAINSAAGQTAIRHALKGPNTTLAAGRPSGLVALGYARRLLDAGRADTVIAGGVEEDSEARTCIDQLCGGKAPLVEGCAMVRLARTGPGLAEVVAVASLFAADGDFGTAVRRAVRRVLAPGTPVWAALTSGTTGDPEFTVVADSCRPDVMFPPLTETLGEAHAVSATFQLAAVLSHAAAAPAAGRLALLTSVDPGGAVAAALLRLGAGR